MAGLLGTILNGVSTPVRRGIRMRSTPDPDTGKTIVVPVEEQGLLLSPQNSADSLSVSYDRFYHCRCNAQEKLGGRCQECNGTSCVRCHGHCCICHKPICPEHSLFVDTGSQRLRFCRACHQALRRKRVKRMVVQGLLRPFVTFNSKDGGP